MNDSFDVATRLRADATDVTAALNAFAESWSIGGGGVEAMRSLFVMARQWLRTGRTDAWREVARAHPIAAMIWQDPFTDWSFRRPRGYPGDATLIDFIYRHPRCADALRRATDVGLEVNLFTVGTESAVAVRERRRIVAHLLDSTIRRTAGAEILAVACGHLREIEISVLHQQAGRIVALDQDADSLSEIETSYGTAGNIQCVRSKIARLIHRPDAHGSFDLIYAAGLYDYLDGDVARRLTTALFSTLKPGGRLCFGNFATGILDDGYMDAFGDWRLVLRDEAQMEAMLDDLPPEALARRSIFRGNNRAIVYTMVERTA